MSVGHLLRFLVRFLTKGSCRENSTKYSLNGFSRTSLSLVHKYKCTCSYVVLIILISERINSEDNHRALLSSQPVKKEDNLPEHSRVAISTQNLGLHPRSTYSHEFRNFSLIPFRTKALIEDREHCKLLTKCLGPTDLCLIAIDIETLPTSVFDALKDTI